MIKLKDFAIDLSSISINYGTMLAATEDATKAAISSAMLIADQVVHDGYKKLHLKADNVEIVVDEGVAMIVLEENTIVASIDHLVSMDYSLNFNLSQLIELLSALVKLGERFKKGDVEFEYDFLSKDLELADRFLDMFNKTKNMDKHIMYQNYNIKIFNEEITMDGKTILCDGVYYYNERTTKILLDLLYHEEAKQNKYVLFGKSNSNVVE